MKHAVFFVMWAVFLWLGFAMLEVPGGLPWYQTIGGGACLGLANSIYAEWWRS